MNRGLRVTPVSHLRSVEPRFVAPRLDRPSRQAV
jgi:hypothetical protein